MGKGLGAGGARAQPLVRLLSPQASVSFPEGGAMLCPAELVGHTGDLPKATSKPSPPLPSRAPAGPAPLPHLSKEQLFICLTVTGSRGWS